MTRSSVDLPPPLGPSSAVSEPSGTVERDVVERDEVAEALATFAADLDAPFRRASLRSSSVIASSVTRWRAGPARPRPHRRRSGRTAWKRSSTSSVSVSVSPTILPRDDADGAELAERARGRQHHAVGDAPADRRQRDPPERLPPATRRASRRPAPARSPISRSTGTTSRTTNGSETKIVASTMPGSAKMTWMPWSRASRRTSRCARDQDQREPDDDRRDGERQVDERVEDAPPRNRLAHEHAAPRRRRRRCSAAPRSTTISERQPEGVHAPPGSVTASQAGAEAVLEGPAEDEADRQHEQQRRGSRARPCAGASREATAHARPPAPTGSAIPSSTHERDHEQHAPRPPRRRLTRSLSICPKMNTDATSVLNGMLPAISTMRAELADRAGERRARRRRGSPAPGWAG